jgi:hypothetical protein
MKILAFRNFFIGWCGTSSAAANFGCSRHSHREPVGTSPKALEWGNLVQVTLLSRVLQLPHTKPISNQFTILRRQLY